jgi:hypothetical protein
MPMGMGCDSLCKTILSLYLQRLPIFIYHCKIEQNWLWQCFFYPIDVAAGHRPPSQRNNPPNDYELWINLPSEDRYVVASCHVSGIKYLFVSDRGGCRRAADRR